MAFYIPYINIVTKQIFYSWDRYTVAQINMHAHLRSNGRCIRLVLYFASWGAVKYYKKEKMKSDVEMACQKVTQTRI